MKKLTANEILVNDRLNGKKDSPHLIKRALLEIKFDDQCEFCRNSVNRWDLKVYRIYKRPLDNRRENFELLCSECFNKTRKRWKPSRPNMSLWERVAEEICEQEDRNVFKILNDTAKNGFI